MVARGLLTVDEWIALRYAQRGPAVRTVHRWIREGLIYPAPEKHGRAYYLHPDARYVDPANPPADLKPLGRPSPFRAKEKLA